MDETHTVVGKNIRLRLGPNRRPTAIRTFHWIFYLAASFYFGAVFLRAILTYGNTPELIWVLGILLIWLAFFASEPAITSRWSSYFSIYLIIQTLLVFLLLSSLSYPDFFAALFAILSMQVMLHLDTKMGIAWIALCALGMTIILANIYKSQTIALVLLNTVGLVFYSAFSLAIRGAQDANTRNQALAQELEAANQKLQIYTAQIEQLAAARERNRLARDLHDSVTQTVFSMTLTTQSAALLLERDPDKVPAQLDRLSHLARNALAEIQLLISELRSSETLRDGLAATLKRYLANKRFPENLTISLEVQGEQSVNSAEEQGLFHIVQEAMNNIVKHSQATNASVRLHLNEPQWIEIEDRGQGFNLQKAEQSGRLGLLGMRERAAEIGWDLHIITSPGHGTCVRVEKLPVDQRQARQV